MFEVEDTELVTDDSWSGLVQGRAEVAVDVWHAMMFCLDEHEMEDESSIENMQRKNDMYSKPVVRSRSTSIYRG